MTLPLCNKILQYIMPHALCAEIMLSDPPSKERLSHDSAVHDVLLMPGFGCYTKSGAPCQQRMQAKFPRSLCSIVKVFHLWELCKCLERGCVRRRSCFANAALQCLMATRPMGAYLASGLHTSRGCPAPPGAFCPLCQLELLAREMRRGDGPATAQPLLHRVRLFCRDMVAGEQVVDCSYCL